jgi:hypothetical protein
VACIVTFNIEVVNPGFPVSSPELLLLPPVFDMGFYRAPGDLIVLTQLYGT